MPIRKGDGTTLTIPGIQEVRTGDGRILYTVGEDAEPPSSGYGADGYGEGNYGDENTESVESRLETEFHVATNDHRSSQGLSDYEYRDDVAAVARSHSQNMYEQDNLSHTLDGQDNADRLNEAGIEWNSIGENIAYQSTDPIDDSATQSQLETIAQSFLDSWLSSSGHRENIESSRAGEGIGVYIDDTDNIVWATAVFISP